MDNGVAIQVVMSEKTGDRAAVAEKLDSQRLDPMTETPPSQAGAFSWRG
jgi:hypothetical protein